VRDIGAVTYKPYATGPTLLVFEWWTNTFIWIASGQLYP